MINIRCCGCPILQLIPAQEASRDDDSQRD